MLRTKLITMILAVLGGLGIAEGASLSVGNLAMPPGSTATVTVFGSIADESTFGVTVLVELVPRTGAVGTLTFTTAPPADISQGGDPWPGAGTFSAYDTDVTGSGLLNGTVDDNGTFVPALLTYSGPLSRFPVTASASASGIWDVRLSTSAGDSGWEGVTTGLTAGAVTVTASACLVDADCSDGDVCTNDFCNAGVCEFPNNTAPCNDGDLCTTGDVCSGGTCTGTPVNCSGLNDACNVGVCNPGTGMCQAVPANEGATCTDGNLCTSNDRCTSGVCVGTPVDCSALNNACNIGVCNQSTGLCQAAPANKGGPCNDGNLCTQNDICMAGVCAGAPVDCSALNNACNVGVCNGATGMCQPSPTNEGGACNDSNVCTQNDRCTAGVCSGTAVNCSALNNTCNVGVCNSGTGACEAMPANEGGICNDNNTCTNNDVCTSGVCTGTPIAGCDPCSVAADCDDGNLCTDDSCHPAGVCIHSNNSAACNDGQFCTATDVCSAGSCVGTGDPCPGQLCDETNNVCVDCLVHADCDDGNICTTDVCVGGACQHNPNTLACNDGLFCTLSDQCSGGTCVGSGDSCPGQLCNESTNTCVDCLTNADCDDGDVCTTDTCSAGSCGYTNNMLPCNDGLFCTANDNCAGGVCVGAGDPCPGQLCSEKFNACVECLGVADCDDGNVCTNDTCTVGNCGYTNNTLPCDDGLFCTDTDTCSGGACVGSGDPCAPALLCDEGTNSCVECFSALDCDDDNPCTNDACLGGGICQNANNTSPCSDGLFCTLNDVCSGGVCVGGGDPCPGEFCNETTNTCVDCFVHADCNDGNVCTTDTCNAGACVLTNNTSACNDGQFCTLTDVCSGGVCVGSGIPCPGQLCNETNDTCVNCLSDADCNDANVCTNDVCVSGTCQLTNNTAPCDDGLFCTAVDTCSGGVCVGSGDPCPGQMCNETTNVCANCLVDTDCGDGNVCTDDTCVSGACQHTNNVVSCNDGNICTITDRCANGVCAGTPVDCSALDTDCVSGICNATTGQCQAVNVNEGGPCDDGDLCTATDTCAAGLCDGSPVDCSGLNSFCRVGSCNPANGACQSSPINEGTACNDGNICTSSDACTGGFCIGTLMPGCDPCSTAADCDDTNECTSDFCHPVGVCYHGNVSGSCDDSNACTQNDTCSSGTCVGSQVPGCILCSTAADCNDNSPCTIDSCVGGVCQYSPNNGVACDDNNICTSTDTCSGGACAGTPIAGCDECSADPECNDGNPCTTDSCHPVGICIYANNTLPCNDGIACTQNDVCNNATCAGTPTPDGGACDDGSSCTTNDTCTGGVCDGVPANDGASCNDGSICTFADVCAGGACAGTPNDCSPLTNACNVGVCNETTGMCAQMVANNGGACNDGAACTQNDTCGAGVCSGTSVDCSPLTGICAIGTCNSSTGLCEAIPRNEGSPCDDQSLCTSNDSCVKGVCTGSVTDCSGLNNTCNVGVCNSGTGSCETAPANEGGVCDDASLCTQNDRCASGACVGTPVDCSGLATACLSSACNPATGSCQTSPINEAGPCSDGDLCTQGDVCTSGSCAGTPMDCSAFNAGCLLGVCNQANGQCQQIPAGEGGACDDDRPCTQNDVCTGGVCDGVPADCSGLTTVCTLGVCNGTTGACQALPTNQGGACNDNNRCTVNDRCNAGVCAGTAMDCSSLNTACTAGTCNPSSGLCYSTPTNQGGPCNDGYACTNNDVCNDGECHGTSTVPEVVDLIWSPSSTTITVGSTVQVSLIARSATCFPQDVGSIQAILSWNPARLRLGGHVDNGPYAWSSSGFPNDSGLDGLNAPYTPVPGNDGLAFYLAVASFVDGAQISPGGMVVTSFQFEALTTTPGTQLSIPATAGSATMSSVLAEGVFNDITGSLGSATITVVQCLNNGHCNDNNVCTTDVCLDGACLHGNNTSPCNDGLFCTVNDVCSGGTCSGSGTPCPANLFCSEPTDSCVQCLQNSHCNDNNVCTTDTCNSGTCVFTNNSEPCDDGFFCTPTDLCVAGGCMGSGLRCPGQFCNEATDSCVQCLNSTHCNDGNVCTNDACVSGACQYTNNANACNDGQFCTQNDSCSGGTCVGSGNPCTGGLFCDETTDGCVQCLNAAHCSDGNICTNDVCTSGTCSHPNNSVPCDDGLFCTSGDQCAGGSCAGGAGNACPGQLCDEANNGCVDCFVAADCVDGFSCTTESCQNGLCQYVTNNAMCGDNLFCTGTETCQIGAGCVSSGPPCDSPGLCDEAGDFCRCPQPAVTVEGPRHLQVVPAAGTVPVAIRVSSVDPDLFCLPKYAAADGSLVNAPVFQSPAAWGTLHVSSRYIEPSTAMRVQSDCRLLPTDPANLSPVVAVSTALWGDLNNSGDVDVSDVLISLDAFAAKFLLHEADILPCEPDDNADVSDILAILDAFASQPYPCPAPCP